MSEKTHFETKLGILTQPHSTTWMLDNRDPRRQAVRRSARIARPVARRCRRPSGCSGRTAGPRRSSSTDDRGTPRSNANPRGGSYRPDSTAERAQGRTFDPGLRSCKAGPDPAPPPPQRRSQRLGRPRRDTKGACPIITAETRSAPPNTRVGIRSGLELRLCMPLSKHHVDAVKTMTCGHLSGAIPVDAVADARAPSSRPASGIHTFSTQRA